MSVSPGTVRRRWTRFLPIAGLVGAVIAWLWPIGLGGAMPVGGDVTSFSIGLMGFLGRSLGEGRLPLWNDLWGYGFPGLAESQMGVFYPPHLLLYGTLPAEHAYAASLVLHTLWGALGAYWAARRMEVSPWGAALAGLAWCGCGFFLIHLPHQWGYTAGSWMSWAWGLAWCSARGGAGMRPRLRLAAVLALQVLPGHFQLAFETQVGVLAIAAWSLVDGPGSRKARLGTAVGLVAAVLAVAPLSAAQVLPTAQLAHLAKSQRDYVYLSGFSATPLHLINFVAPGLFHRSPLWRPVAWDPFHTSPEEYLGYVGLVPLFLASGAILRSGRRDRSVRLLAMLVVGSLVLSIGPYVPGFSTLCRLPGFSFFRAPARWDLATSLGLALLAGKGFDLIPSGWERPGRSLARFVLGAVVAMALVVGLFELALASTEGRGLPRVASLYAKGMGWLPWSDDRSFREVAVQARRPQDDLRVRVGMARLGDRGGSRSGWRWDRERASIYRQELPETALLLVALLAAVPLAGRGRALPIALGLLTFADLFALSRHRPTDLGPIRSFVSQSPVLAEDAAHPHGERTADTLSNFSMLAGAAPIGAYRTLDLPVVPRLTLLARGPLARPDSVVAALRATGTTHRLLDFSDLPRLPDETPKLAGTVRAIRDPALAGWLYGADWVRGEGAFASRFASWTPGVAPTRAWFLPRSEGSGVGKGTGSASLRAVPVPLSDGAGRAGSGDRAGRGSDPQVPVPLSDSAGRVVERTPDVAGRGTGKGDRHLEDSEPVPFPSRSPSWHDVALQSLSANQDDALIVIDALALATPQTFRSSRPERAEVGVEATGSGLMILSQLHDPEWKARLIGPGGERDAEVLRVFGTPGAGAWQGVEIPEKGTWTIRLTYEGRAARMGLVVSGVAWMAWVLAYWRSGRNAGGESR